jgi:hypothetical protein
MPMEQGKKMTGARAAVRRLVEAIEQRPEGIGPAIREAVVEVVTGRDYHAPGVWSPPG